MLPGDCINACPQVHVKVLVPRMVTIKRVTKAAIETISCLVLATSVKHQLGIEEKTGALALGDTEVQIQAQSFSPGDFE